MRSRRLLRRGVFGGGPPARRFSKAATASGVMTQRGRPHSVEAVLSAASSPPAISRRILSSLMRQRRASSLTVCPASLMAGLLTGVEEALDGLGGRKEPPADSHDFELDLLAGAA